MMMFRLTDRRSRAIAVALGVSAVLAACGSKEPAPAATTAAAPPAPAATAPAPAAPAEQVAAKTWSPEALEELLAPIALYPDPILSQVLIASTNPQEVLDAGNWLLANQGLKDKALDDAAAKVGFTPPVRALVQFPETVDMMCMEMDWTTELGEAFVADQQGVLDAVQRLRKQAQEVGNLKSSDMMKVENQVQDGKEVVVLSPPKPDVVYVPQYDPQAVYAPPPATTTTTTTTEKQGYSTGTLITTGLLAFGAGMLVNELFDDDDNHHHNNDYYYPNYGHGGMPYYPPYPYRPSYGNGYYPANGYNRPPNYQHGFNNNNVVIVNKDGNNYWNDRSARQTGYKKSGAYQAKSPISAAKPNRPELQELNKRQPKPMPKDVQRPSSDRYAGGKTGAPKPGKDYMAPGKTGNVPAAGGKMPKVQGSYAGATPDRVQSQQQAKGPSATKKQGYDRPAAQPSKAGGGGGDRGYDKAARPQPSSKPAQASKPQQMQKQQPASRPSPAPDRSTAMSGADRGSADRAASQRGKQSMPQGAKSKGGGGGGNKKKQGR
jgi:hypothetical protein